MSAFTIVFIHGYTASPKSDWYPNITDELSRLDVEYVIPDLPGDKQPHAKEWLEALHVSLAPVDKEIVLVGHSLGSRAALLYLEKYKRQAKKVFLIAAFANETKNAKRNEGKAYPDFFKHKIDLPSIKPLVEKFVVMHSADDASIPYSQGVEIANQLGADLITFTDRNHFTEPENAPIILDVLRKELNF